MSYHELMFLKAEALCRLNRDAEDALKEAVVAGLLNAENSISIAIKELGSGLNTNSSEVITETSAGKYFDDVVKAKYAANPLQETMIQKYLAMWGASGEATETYNDFRRMKGLNENFITLTNPNIPANSRCATHTETATQRQPGSESRLRQRDYVYSEPVWWAGGSR